MSKPHLGNANAGRREAARDRQLGRQRDDDLRAWLTTPQGRRSFWRVLDRECGLFALSYRGNADTYFREGQRSIGLTLMSEAQRVCPDLYVLALNEQLEEQRLDDLHRSAARDAAEDDDT